MVQNIHINFTKFNSLIQIAGYFHSEEVCKAQKFNIFVYNHLYSEEN